MRKILLLLVIILSTSLIGGCSFNKLGEQPLNQISGNAIWNSPSLMQANLNDMYIGMGAGLFTSTSGLSILTDDAMWTNGAQQVMKSQINPSSLGLLGNTGRFGFLNWAPNYSRIRQTNVFLKRSSDYSGSEQAKVKRMRGQVYFLRAFFYQNLMRMYGGVPLVTEVYSLNSKDFDVSRNSFKETINFIVANCDSAAALLPLKYTSDEDLGRATKGAALSLKARVLLYAASDLYNVNPSSMAVTGYKSDTPSERKTRWKKAQQAAKAVMDLGIYHLYKAHPAPGDSTAKNYDDIFLDQPNAEIIMAKHYNIAHGGVNNIGEYFMPNGWDGWSENSPTQQFVDAFEMKDGSKFTWKNPKEAAHPYENRDPRFYAEVLYDGAHFRPRFSDAASLDPHGIVQTFKKITLPGGKTLPGLDTRNGPIQNWNGSYTGYCLRKFIDPEVNWKESPQTVPWPYFRYAEILLDYAEASIGLGQDGKARTVLNKIRVRAGMPKFGPSVAGHHLLEEYRNERRVEMGAELQRFFDVRRWMIAPKVLNENAKGIDITVKGESRADRSSYYDYKYKVVSIRDRVWDNKMYFAPIPLAEMNRNSKLVQNPGY
jgi:hypothetical protein